MKRFSTVIIFLVCWFWAMTSLATAIVDENYLFFREPVSESIIPSNCNLCGICAGSATNLHTGVDYMSDNNGVNTSTSAYAVNFGLLWRDIDYDQNVGCGSLSCNMGNTIIIKHLTDSGEIKLSSYSHLFSKTVSGIGARIVKSQQMGIIGNSGKTLHEWGPNNNHIHLEIKKPDLGYHDLWPFGYMNQSEANSLKLSGETTITIPDAINRVFTTIDNLRNSSISVLFPFFSFLNNVPNSGNYEVYGIANNPLYASITLSPIEEKTFNNIGVGGRIYNNNEIRDVFINDTVYFTADQTRTLSGNNTFDGGDYRFFAYIQKDQNGNIGEGYPIKFSLLSNKHSKIVDNDQSNTKNCQYNQSTGSGDTNIVPGYYCSAQLVKGQSNAWAQWKPYISGTYKVYVHIPEGIPSNAIDKVFYRIKIDGTDENQILSNPINQRGNIDRWVQITSSDTDEFNFTSQGYVEICLGTDLSDPSSNADVDENTWVAFDAMKFDVTNIDVALIIDSSGSMTWNDPQDLRKEAAKIFIDTAQNNDQVAVVDFDSWSYLCWPLQPLTENRDSIKSAVNLINSSGGTSLSAGLLEGYNQLNSSTQPYKKAAVFLTDGVGSYNNEAELYRNEGNDNDCWPIYTIGLGYSTNPALLQSIADTTGGKYFALTDPDQLKNVYFEIATQISGGTSLLGDSAVMTTGDTYSTLVAVPTGQQSTTFLTTWPGSDVETTLITPSNTEITQATNDPNIYYAKGLTYELYRITNPEAGNWTISLFGADLQPGGEAVNISVSTIGPPVPQDTTPPLITISNPIDGKVYFDQLPTNFAFTVEDPETAITSQTILLNNNPINNNDNILLTQLGENTLTITATNEVNLTNELSITFYVNHFAWLPPIKYQKGSATETITYVAQANSTLPIKFDIFDANNSFVEDATAKVIVEGTTAQFVCGEGDTNIRINQEKGDEPLYIVNLHTNLNRCDYGLEAGNEYNLTVYFNDILAAKTKLKIE